MTSIINIDSIDDMYDIITKKLLSVFYGEIDELYITNVGRIVIVVNNKHITIEPATLAMLCKKYINDISDSYIISYSKNTIKTSNKHIHNDTGYAKLITPSENKETLEYVVYCNKLYTSITGEILAVLLITKLYIEKSLEYNTNER